MFGLVLFDSILVKSARLTRFLGRNLNWMNPILSLMNGMRITILFWAGCLTRWRTSIPHVYVSWYHPWFLDCFESDVCSFPQGFLDLWVLPRYLSCLSTYLGTLYCDYFGYLLIRWEELAWYEPLSDFSSDGVVESKCLDCWHTYQFWWV